MGSKPEYPLTLRFSNHEVELNIKDGGGAIKTNFERADIPEKYKFLHTGEDDRECYCDNCDWTGPESKLDLPLEEVDHLTDRLDAGCEVIAGTCPECAAGCYLTAVNDYESALEAAHAFNGAIDAIESTILAHACSGVDVRSPEYLEGIKTAVDAVSHQFEEV
jgi:hypothetical protein